MSVPSMVIGDRRIGKGQPTYVIAELSANHHGSLERAMEIVRAAAAAGADAVKLQTYTPDSMTIDSDLPPFRVKEGTLWAGRNLYDLYREASTPWEWHAPLQEVTESLGLHFFSTPFDVAAVEFLDRLGTPVYKVASFELVDLELVRQIASRGKPLIVSTGMASAEEINAALAVATEAGAGGVALLRCNSAYPAPTEEMDLMTIPDMARRWKVPIGLSDHTLGATTAVAAVALGACILEKHLTLSRDDPGPDAAFSLEPPEFAALVSDVRTVERSLGRVRYGPSPSEERSLAFRRSLFVVRDVVAGQPLAAGDVRSIRPGDGLPPAELTRVVGRRARVDIARGTPLRWDLLD